MNERRGFVKFIDKLEDAEMESSMAEITKTVETIDGKIYRGIFAHPHSKIVFKNIHVPGSSKLLFSVALKPEAWEKPGDGVVFKITIKGENDERIAFYQQHLNPQKNKNHRRWITENLSISARGELTFIFETTNKPEKSLNYDWALWGEPVLINSNDR